MCGGVCVFLHISLSKDHRVHRIRPRTGQESALGMLAVFCFHMLYNHQFMYRLLRHNFATIAFRSAIRFEYARTHGDSITPGVVLTPHRCRRRSSSRCD